MKDMEWQVLRYDEGRKAEWNSFLSNARNATFLFNRNYMDYHAHRFADCSLMLYHNNRLMALLPAHIRDRVLSSHSGLTYGGFITHDNCTTELMLQMFAAVREYVMQELDVQQVMYSPIPYIYMQIPSQEDLYALYRVGASLCYRKVSSVIYKEHVLKFSELRRRKVRKAMAQGLEVRPTADFAAFWTILEQNLLERHQSHPVHSLQEMELLHSRFSHEIVLHGVFTPGGDMVAGCVIYKSNRVAHVQYIGSTPEGRNHGAVDLLFHHLTSHDYADMACFDFGTSVEEGGKVLNSGLIFQKEGFGGRAVMYDTYLWNL